MIYHLYVLVPGEDMPRPVYVNPWGTGPFRMGEPGEPTINGDFHLEHVAQAIEYYSRSLSRPFEVVFTVKSALA